MGFNLFGSSKKSTTNNETTNTQTNQQVAAGDSGFAVGSGSNVNLNESTSVVNQDITGDVVKSAVDDFTSFGKAGFDTVDSVNKESLELAGTAVRENRHVASHAIGQVADISEHALDETLDFSTNVVGGSLATVLKGQDNTFEFSSGILGKTIDNNSRVLRDQLEDNEKARSENLRVARSIAELGAAYNGITPPSQNEQVISAVRNAVIAVAVTWGITKLFGKSKT